MDIDFFTFKFTFFSSFGFRLHFFFSNLSFLLHFVFRSPKMDFFLSEFSFCVYNVGYEEKI